MEATRSALLLPRTTGRVELHGAGNQGFRFGLADGESGSAATGPAAATKEQRVTANGRRLERAAQVEAIRREVRGL
jgi:hypothetical protein